MITEKKSLDFIDFFWIAGRFLLFTVFAVLPGRIFPFLKDSDIVRLFVNVGFILAIYPAAKKLGFEYKEVRGYFTCAKAALRPALKYWLGIEALLYISDFVFRAALVPIGLPWSDTLLFWMDQSSNSMVADSYITTLLAAPIRIPLYFISLCLFAPLIEEFIMRRGLYVSMRKKLPFTVVAIMNGALFGILHLKDFVATGLTGFFLCCVYEKEEKLSTVLLIHSFVNLFVALNLFSQKLLGFAL